MGKRARVKNEGINWGGAVKGYTGVHKEISEVFLQLLPTYTCKK